MNWGMPLFDIDHDLEEELAVTGVQTSIHYPPSSGKKPKHDGHKGHEGKNA